MSTGTVYQYWHKRQCRRTPQILSYLADVGNRHSRSFQHWNDVFPGKFRLTGNMPSVIIDNWGHAYGIDHSEVPMSALMYAAWAFAAGAMIPLMAILNAGLARATGGPIAATVLMLAGGLLGLLLLMTLTATHIPAVPTLLRIPPSQYAGGLIVVFYILSITFIAPRLGVGNAILFAVTAQLFTSALIDHFALAGAALRPVTAMRLVGLLVVIAGVILTQVGDRLFPPSH
jgi:bacterial/archaeal transporter family-2 protein